MRRILFALAAVGGLTALAASGASAAPAAPGIHVTPSRPAVTHVDYNWHRHHYQHRRFDHGHWRYWN